MSLTDGFSCWCAASRIRWAVAGLFCLLIVAAMLASGLGVVVPVIPQTGLAVATLAGIAARYRRPTRSPRLSVVAEALLLFIVIFGGGIILSYAAASSSLPYRDAELDAIDRALGFDWTAYAALVDSSPALSRATWLIYLSLIPQLLVLTLTLAIGGHFERLHRFLIAVAITLAITCAVFAFTPAVGAYAYYGASPSDFVNLRPLVTYQHIGPIEGLRSGAIDSLSLADAHGLISFPSFHATGAGLVAWGFWGVQRLRWPFLSLNLMMIAATPIHGAHYLIDVIAGLAIAWAGLAMAGWIAMPRTPAAREMFPLNPAMAG